MKKKAKNGRSRNSALARYLTMAVNAWCFLVDGLIKGTLDLCERGVKRSANKLSRESSTKRIRSDKVW